MALQNIVEQPHIEPVIFDNEVCFGREFESAPNLQPYMNASVEIGQYIMTIGQFTVVNPSRDGA